MLESAEKIHNVEETFDAEKQRRLSEIQKTLAKERKRRKEQLRRKQIQEAKEAGLDPEKVRELML